MSSQKVNISGGDDNFVNVSATGNLDIQSTYKTTLTKRIRLRSAEGGVELPNIPCAFFAILNTSEEHTAYWSSIDNPPYMDKGYVGDFHGEPIYPLQKPKIGLTNTNLVRVVGYHNDEIVVTAYLNTNTIPDVDLSSPPEITAPTILSTTPPQSSTDQIISTNIVMIASEALDPETVHNASATITPSVAFTCMLDPNDPTKIIIDPTSDLAFATVYTITLIATVIRDTQEDNMAENFVLSFTTAAAPDTTRPTVISRTPLNAATGQLITVNGTVTFSEAMNAATITNTTCRIIRSSDSANQTATVSLSADKKTVTVNPNASLAYSTGYTLRVTTGVQDLAGNALLAQSDSTFTTEAAPVTDTTRPTITTRSPASGATSVAVSSNIVVTFSEAMLLSSITSTTCVLLKSGVTVNRTISLGGSNKVVTMDPTSSLVEGTVYTVRITTGVKDLAGNALLTQSEWTFTTAVTQVLLYNYSGTSWTELNHNSNKGSGLRLDSSSSSGTYPLYNKKPMKVIITMRREGSPGGTLTCKICHDGGGVLSTIATIGTLSANSVTTGSSGSQYTFEDTTQSHRMAVDDSIMLSSSLGDDDEYIEIRRTDSNVWSHGILLRENADSLEGDTDTSRDWPVTIYGTN